MVKNQKSKPQKATITDEHLEADMNEVRNRVLSDAKCKTFDEGFFIELRKLGFRLLGERKVLETRRLGAEISRIMRTQRQVSETTTSRYLPKSWKGSKTDLSTVDFSNLVI